MNSLKILHVTRSVPPNTQRFFLGDNSNWFFVRESIHTNTWIWCYTAHGLAWDAALKKTGVQLEFIRDPDMLLVIERGRWLFNKRHAVTNIYGIIRFQTTYTLQQLPRCQQPLWLGSVFSFLFNDFFFLFNKCQSKNGKKKKKKNRLHQKSGLNSNRRIPRLVESFRNLH